MSLMLRPPNTFLCYWSNKQLKNWLKELYWRNKFKDIWANSMVPTIKQTKNEIKRRK